MFGVWRKQDNPVKTSAAMLKTFGLINTKRPAKTQKKQVNPTFNFRIIQKKRRKRR